MKQLLSFVDACWLSLTTNAALAAFALGLAVLAFSAAACLGRLKSDADTKIEDIDRSLDQHIRETKRRKELLRAERMLHIRAKLEERIREMVRASKNTIKRRLGNRNEHNGLLRVPIPAASPERGHRAAASRFNSFVAPPHGLSASLVENMPASGKKFASSQKKTRFGKAGADSHGPANGALDASYQVSMPSSLRRQIEIRSYHEARDRHFALGWRDHHAHSRKRATAHIERTEDQHGRLILQLRRPRRGQQRIRFFSIFSLVEKGHSEINAAFRAKMAQEVVGYGDRLSNRHQVEGSPGQDTPFAWQKEPSQAELDGSRGQVLQGEYLSPEQLSLACSRSAPGSQMQPRSSPEDPQNPRLSLQKCPEQSPEQDEWEEHQRSPAVAASRSSQGASKSKLRAPLHRRSQHQLASELLASTPQASSPGPCTPLKAGKRQAGPQSTSSISPSIASTLHGLTSSHRRQEELQAIHELLILRQNTVPEPGSSKAKKQAPVPLLDFEKVEEIRRRDLASEESSSEALGWSVDGKENQYKSPPSAHQMTNENPEVDSNAVQSQAENSQEDGVHPGRRKGASGGMLPWRSPRHQVPMSENEHPARQSGHQVSRFGGLLAAMGLRATETPELNSYTKSEIERSCELQNHDNQQNQPLQPPSNGVTDSHPATDHANKEEQGACLGISRLRRPFDYASRNGPLPSQQAYSQPVHRLGSALDRPSFTSHNIQQTQVNEVGQESSKEQEQSNEYSHSATPKDSFVYSNSTQTAAQNSQGPLLSNGKSLTVVKSSPTNNLDGQSGFIGSFLTQNDLQFNSVKGSCSIQSNVWGGPSPPLPTTKLPTANINKVHHTSVHARPTSPFQLQVPSPARPVDRKKGASHAHSNSTPPVNHQDNTKPTIFNESTHQTIVSQPSSSLQAHLRKKTMIIQNLRGTYGKVDSVTGTVIAPIDEVKVEYFSEDGEQKRSPKDGGNRQRRHDRQEIGSQSQETIKSQKLKSDRIQEEFLHITNQKYAELQTQSKRSFILTEKKAEAGERGDEVLHVDQAQVHKSLPLDVLNEGNHSSQHNLQSISFNISSSRQSSPNNNLVSILKLVSSQKMSSQKSVGPHTDNQGVHVTGPSMSPTPSLPNSSRTLKSATAGQSSASQARGTSSACALSPGKANPPTESPLGGAKHGDRQQHPHFNITKSHSKSGGEGNHAMQRPPRLQPALDPRRMAKQGGLSEDLMAKVRKRKTQILRAGEPQGGPDADQEEQTAEEAATQAQELRVPPLAGSRNYCKRLDFNVSRTLNTREQDVAGQAHDQQTSSWRSHGKQVLSPKQALSSPNFTPTKHNTFSNPQNPGKTLAFTSQSRDNQAEDRSHQSAVNPFTHHDEADNDTSSAKKSERQKGKASAGSLDSPSKSRPPLIARGQHLLPKKSNPFSAEHARNTKKHHAEQKIPTSRSQEGRATSEDTGLALRFQVEDAEEAPRVRSAAGGAGATQGQQRRRTAQRGHKNYANQGEADGGQGTGRELQEESPAASPSKKKSREQPSKSNKKSKSGDKKAQAKRQLPPLAQRKGKSTKSGSQLSRSSPGKPSANTMTAEEKSQQMKELNQKLAVIKKKQFQLPLSSTLKHNSSSSLRSSSLRIQQPKGKLLEVVSKANHVSQLEKSGQAPVAGNRGTGPVGGESAQGRSSLPAKSFVWNLQRTNSTAPKRQPKLGSGFAFGRKQQQSFGRSNERPDASKSEEEKESQSHHLASPRSCNLMMSLQASRTAMRRAGSSAEAPAEPQSAPQVALRRKLQVLKQRRGTVTSLSSSNQSDNQSSYTDDAHELMELQQHFEAHHERLRSRSSAAGSIEANIVRTIKALGESHYLPVQHVQASHYLAGVKIIHCEMVGDEVLVRVGGGYESLKHYVRSNSRNFQRQITSTMKKSGHGISWVVEQLVQGQKHKIAVQRSGVVAPAVTSPGRGHIFSRGAQPVPSPMSVPSVPHAKSSIYQQASRQHVLSQSLRSDSSIQLPRVARQGSFRLARSPAAANLRVGGPLAPGRPKHS